MRVIFTLVRMELSGIELQYLVNEISGKATGGYYVSGVNAITKSSLLLKLHHPSRRHHAGAFHQGHMDNKAKVQAGGGEQPRAYAQAHLSAAS